MILAVTGHRPHHLAGGYSEATHRRLYALAVDTLEAMAPDHVRTGMAQGWDQACAEAAGNLAIPYTAVLPGLARGTQDQHWPKPARDRYFKLFQGAYHVQFCPFAGAGREFNERDYHLVEPADMVLALWDGTPSGTGVTVDIARRLRVPVWNVWNIWCS